MCKGEQQQTTPRAQTRRGHIPAPTARVSVCACAVLKATRAHGVSRVRCLEPDVISGTFPCVFYQLSLSGSGVLHFTS